MSDLLSKIIDAQVAAINKKLRPLSEKSADNGYEKWLKKNFPHVATGELCERMHNLWKWFDRLEKGTKPSARIDPWARGAAKSSTAELGVVYLSQKMTRHFVLYVSETQKQANKHVQSIASLMAEIGARRKVSTYGHAKGWKSDQISTDMGFHVMAVGLDGAVRGMKIDWLRPDVIIFDDIDSRHDTPDMRKRKMDTIRDSILPAGSSDCAVLFLQNLISEDSIMSQLVDGRAEFLLDREVCKAEPAIYDLVFELRVEESGAKRYYIKSGTPSWPGGQDIDTCEKQINEWGIAAFLREAQHQVRGADGVFFHASKIEIVPATTVNDLLSVALAWDIAATEGAGDHTVGALLGLRPTGKIVIMKIIRGQWSSGTVKRRVEASAQFYTNIYKDRFTVLLKQDPGQAGKAQKNDYAAALANFNVEFQVETGSKAVKARPFADAMECGMVQMIADDWNADFISEHRDFREDEPPGQVDDQVDAASSAAIKLLLSMVIVTSSPIRGDMRLSDLLTPGSGTERPLCYDNHGLLVPNLPNAQRSKVRIPNLTSSRR